MRGWRLALIAIITAALIWAMRTSRPPTPSHEIRPPEPPSALLATAFERSKCGSLTCSVRWEGELPKREPLVLQRPIAQVEGKREVSNPNEPRIGPKKGLADCAVWLQGVNLAESKPWDHAPVTLEPTISKLVIHQGEKVRGIGIVRRGDAINLVTHEAASHSVIARGAAFFTQMLFDIDRPVRRVLPDDGIVELSSGTGSYWHRGYLVVSEHPYVGVTDENGEVKFDWVPAGDYEVVLWRANWHVAAMERDPELIRHVRLQFHAPGERRERVTILPGKGRHAEITFSQADFKTK
jgi:hypothetical protein